ncbi:uncharacterized protein LOC126997752 [Eriocheir sinensis]|uniref:uncharacterized protein LOC126997752 n=1 Tax=Eriocheir sinensis TaxID=95602 RepID=UPI0021C78CCD|nr:uncharacterized protein LOC126997752 [Eriocheir sinensis]XP_050714946.1 uncharacterized protein LOC126997752 [Eriocheir sinensis]
MKASLKAALACYLLTVASLDAAIWNHFLVPQKTFDPSNAFFSFNDTSACACKSKCMVLPACTGWTAVAMNTTEPQCLLTSGNPRSIGLAPSSNAIYGFVFREDAIPGVISAEKGHDGLAYHVPPNMMTIEPAREYCESIPGFRLAIFRTFQQIEDGKQMAIKASSNTDGLLLIDLQSTAGSLLWGDGSLFPSLFSSLTSDTSKPNIVISRTVIGSKNQKRHILCQGRSGNQLW